MNKRILILSAAFGFGYLFCGFYLGVYFQEQAAIATFEGRLAQQQTLERILKAAE